MQTLDSIKNHLLRQVDKWERGLNHIEGGEGDNSITPTNPEASELGTFSWYQSVMENKAAVKARLLEARKKAKEALVRVRNGTFGICESCGKEIEQARLKIMPTTTSCVACK